MKMPGHLFSRRASVLLLVLWMLMLLGVVGLSYSASVRTQVRAMRATRGRTEAVWAARAGIEKARVMLAQAPIETLREGDPLLNDPEIFANQPVGLAQFTLLKPQLDPMAEPQAGLLDEASRLNINAAGRGMLMRLPGMTEDLADALIDWRDGDDLPRAYGAEADYYLSLENPYRPRNAALHDLRELLRVKGWEPVFRSVYPDPYSRYSRNSDREMPTIGPDDARRMMDMVTVWSMDDGKAPDGQDKMDLGSVNAATMRQRIENLTEDEARAIEQWRNGNQYQNATDLLKVTKPREGNTDQDRNRNNNNDNRNGNNSNNRGGGNNNNNNNRGGGNNNRGGGNNNRGGGNNNNNNNRNSGERMFSLARVGEIIDFFKAGNQQEDPNNSGKININTASRDVLMLVPGITEQIADAIVSGRAREAYAGAGALASVSGMTEELFTQRYRRFTGRSYRFHVWSRGQEPDSGATFTAEAVLARDGTDVSIVYWREY